MENTSELHARMVTIFEALQAEEITPAHRFVLTEIMAHIEELEGRIARFDAELLRSLQGAGSCRLLSETLTNYARLAAYDRAASPGA